MAGIVALSVEHWNGSQEVVGSRLNWAHGHVKNEGKFYTSMCLCHQAVEVVTGLRVVSPDGWEGNCGPGQKVTAAYCWVYDYACVCRCGLGGRWWQPTSGFMTMQHHLQADC